MNSLNNLIHNTGISKGTCITQLIFLSSQNLSQYTSHDLSRSRLWQIFHDNDTFRGGKGTNSFTNLENEFFSELRSSLDIIFERYKRIDSYTLEVMRREGTLSSKFILSSDDGCFSDTLVHDQCSFDFCSRQTMATDIDNIIDTSSNPVKSFMISSGAITRKLRLAACLMAST
jgi:hypothetical protein